MKKRICNATELDSLDQKGIDQLLRATSEEVYGTTTNSLAVYRWAREVALGLTDFEDVPDELKTDAGREMINNYIRYASAEIPCEEMSHD